MGLMLSILVGCVGVIELLAALKQVTNDVQVSSPPCLYYHDSIAESPSFHDSICSITHSGDLRMPKSAKSKLENLHEYSLRVRSQLRSHGYGDGSTLSEISSRDALGMLSRPDSRLSIDFDHVLDDDDHNKDDDNHNKDDHDHDPEVMKIINDPEITGNTLKIIPTAQQYVRVPSPFPLTLSQELSRSNSSIERFDRSASYDNDSGNELPTKDSIQNDSIMIPGYSSSSARSSIEETARIYKKLRKKKIIKRNQSKSPEFPMDIVLQGELLNSENTLIPLKKPKTTTVLRKPTRLKSRNAEISKSAENLLPKKTKRQRDPERRKSDISVQTVQNDSFRDEWTNTSPSDSERLLSASRSSVSVEVQTNFDGEDKCTFSGLRSESNRDIELKFKNRGSFRNKRFPKSRSLDDNASICGRINQSSDNQSSETCDRGQIYLHNLLRQQTHEEDEESIDEEFLDAEDTNNQRIGPIEYCIPNNQETGSAFWLIFSGEYTKAMNKDWHSGHFCCWQCDESLTGQRYVLRDEHPYCIKCYESVFANGCEECNKIIGIDSKDLSYKDKHWHEACFLCHKCRVSLVDKQFGSKVDKIYCGNCYDAQFASRCDGCGEIFRADAMDLSPEMIVY